MEAEARLDRCVGPKRLPVLDRLALDTKVVEGDDDIVGQL